MQAYETKEQLYTWDESSKDVTNNLIGISLLSQDMDDEITQLSDNVSFSISSQSIEEDWGDYDYIPDFNETGLCGL